MMPKNQQHRSREDEGFGFERKPVLDERLRRGRDALRGDDKQQEDLRDADASRGQPRRGEPPVLPEGLRRERKGPYDKDLGRNEAATHVPSNRRSD